MYMYMYIYISPYILKVTGSLNFHTICIPQYVDHQVQPHVK